MAVADPMVSDDVTEAVDGGEDVGTLNVSGVARAGMRSVLRSRGALRHGAHLTGEVTRIAIGRSSVHPDRKDWRFRDPAWEDHPLYRRLMQLYLASSDELLGLVDDADLDWRDRERARFVANVMTSAAAPTNTLLGNPEAIKRAFDTAGASTVRGLRNYVRDLVTNRGMPAQVDARRLKVGETLAVTPGAVVYRDELCEVLQYTPMTPEVRSRPVLLIPPQIGKYYFMDLAPGRSFAEYAVDRGIPFFAISWRNPGRGQRGWALDDYAEAALRAIDVVRDVARSDDVNVLGLCAGGILTAGVLNHLAAEDDDRVKTASFGVTLLDFDVPATIGMFDSRAALTMGRARSRSAGVLDGRSLSAVFALLRPNELIWNYWVNNYLLGKDPPAFDILAWNADSTNLPAALHRDFLDLFRTNAMARPDAMKVLGTPVDLSRVELETYVTGATTDHITPWKGCYRTTQLMSGPSTFVLSNAGHIASLVNPPGNPKAHFFAGPEPGADPEEWQTQAEQRPGTWWEHWGDWVTERSGEERRAPTRLGSRRHPPLERAPGRYVRGLGPAAA